METKDVIRKLEAIREKALKEDEPLTLTYGDEHFVFTCEESAKILTDIIKSIERENEVPFIAIAKEPLIEPSFEERFRWETTARLFTSFENMTQEKAIEHAENLIAKLKETKR